MHLVLQAKSDPLGHVRQLTGDLAESARVRLDAFKARLAGSANGPHSHGAAEMSGDSGVGANDDEAMFVSKDLFKTCYE